MLKIAYSCFDTILNFFAPPTCASCSVFLSQKDIFCSNCFKKVIPIVSSSLKITSSFEIKVYAAAQYCGPVRRLILKKHIQSYVASRKLGQFIFDSVEAQVFDCDAIVPIPLHWTRKARRGFNQAQVIAQFLSKKYKKPIFDVLSRTRRTKYQAKLNKGDRRKNVSNVFSFKKGVDKCNYKRLLLVDDLMTTGATLKEAAYALRSLKPMAIQAVVAARGA